MREDLQNAKQGLEVIGLGLQRFAELRWDRKRRDAIGAVGAPPGADPPDTRPQAAVALWACQNARPGQIRDGTGGYLGNAGLTKILLLLLKIVRDAAEGNEATLSVRNVCNLPCATWSMNVDWAAALVE